MSKKVGQSGLVVSFRRVQAQVLSRRSLNDGRNLPISATEEDQDDRNTLYYLKWDMKGMAIYPDDTRYRNFCLEVMRDLIAKFPDGYEGWAKERGEEPAPPPPSRAITEVTRSQPRFSFGRI
ncbi:hypothetical protein NA56DRAFT_656273 [Hyaloscypha hepaticicola]|uniref:Uncharacterized protein n=1 Tax=Hyaloscypha hepaticicola TaxID=2082293 RepID=A0A2J6QE57_9HELO|nr:hypothetical protein NA56DRAFT_656273 [Hyaloscypha hepaticicola]